jgi:3-oxo-5-alpha-steroid 4-dehydrogenase 1
MNERTIYNILVLVSFFSAVGVFIALFFVSAPYGRHLRKGWGPGTTNLAGWMVMESPSALLFAFYFAMGSAPKNIPLILFFVLWEAHYVHRAFIYPLTIRDGHKTMPVSVMLLAFGFNLGNSYINGRYLFTFSGGYPNSWVLDPRFITGVVLFISGYIMNRWADTILRGLRRPGETGYSVPYGGPFDWVSCPNYLGEIVEWVGWAIATWSIPGLAFAVWTIANLAPRAHSHHAWYRSHFPNYPQKRRALLPGIW